MQATLSHDIAGSVSSWLEKTRTGKVDRRARRTRERLITALISLLDTKPIDSITVTELTSKADVNRATFYSHYKDVRDILSQLKEDACDLVSRDVAEHGDEIRSNDYRSIVSDIVAGIGNSADAIAVIMGPNGDGTFFSSVIDVLEDGFFKAMSQGNPTVQEQLKEFPSLYDYHFSFIAGGVASILSMWVSNGRKETQADIVDLIMSYLNAISPSVLNASLRTHQGTDQGTSEA